MATTLTLILIVVLLAIGGFLVRAAYGKTDFTDRWKYGTSDYEHNKDTSKK
ncbi:MAG: hypothetical protein SGJ04_03840 [Bacteroidota bacterium]|nr:hypothetical protein [Bacteroidota bacterium]